MMISPDASRAAWLCPEEGQREPQQQPDRLAAGTHPHLVALDLLGVRGDAQTEGAHRARANFHDVLVRVAQVVEVQLVVVLDRVQRYGRVLMGGGRTESDRKSDVRQQK